MVGLVGVADVDGDVLLADGENGHLVQHLCADIGKLAQLVIGDTFDGLGVVNDAGVCHQNAGNVGPVFVDVCIECCCGQSACDVGAASREGLDPAMIQRVLKIALPAAERVIINMGQIIYASMIASIGTAQVAAYHITCTIESLGYMPANGFAAAATTMVGQKLGAKDPNGSERLGQYTVGSSLVFLSVVGLLMFVVRHPLTGLFTSDSDVYYITEHLLVICALIQPFNALSIVTQGSLSGAGDTLRPLIYSLITMWGIRIVFSWILGFYLGYGVYGIYFSMLIDLAVRSTMLQMRFRKGRWKTASI